jgi:hypothetical protein
VLPLLRETVNPEITLSLTRLAAQAERAARLVREIAEDILTRIQVDRTERTLILSADGLAAAPRAIQTEVAILALERLGIGLQEIGFERIEAVVEAAHGSQGRRRIELPGRAVVERRGKELLFQIEPRAEQGSSR